MARGGHDFFVLQNIAVGLRLAQSTQGDVWLDLSMVNCHHASYFGIIYLKFTIFPR